MKKPEKNKDKAIGKAREKASVSRKRNLMPMRSLPPSNLAEYPVKKSTTLSTKFE